MREFHAFCVKIYRLVEIKRKVSYRSAAAHQENYFLVTPTTSPGHSAVSPRRFYVVSGVFTRRRLLVLRIASSAASAVRLSCRMGNEVSNSESTSGPKTRLRFAACL